MSTAIANQPAGFAAFVQPQLQVNRLPKNPMDRCTIVSVYPKEIVEIKHTIQPSLFRIKAAKDDDFTLTSIGSASWLKQMELDQPYQEMYIGSITLAQSIITDYSNSLLGAQVGRGPGLFYIPGEWTRESIKGYMDGEKMKGFSELLTEARAMQNRWYKELIRLADSLWARSNGNPLVISEDSRLAAEKLKVEKAWMADFRSSDLSNCKACGFMVNTVYPICPNCKTVIDFEKAKKLDLKFVAVG